jgi:hypothetical protein
MGLKYVEDQGEWFAFLLKESARLQCCGCGLTHDISVRRVGRRYEMRITRHEPATAAACRARKKILVIADP